MSDNITADTIKEWYLEDCAGSMESRQTAASQDPATGSTTTVKFQDRHVSIVTISRIVIGLTAFTSDEGLEKELPDIKSGPGTGGRLTSIDVAVTADDDEKYTLTEDRLVRDDTRLGQYHQVQRYQYLSEWKNRT